MLQFVPDTKILDEFTTSLNSYAPNMIFSEKYLYHYTDLNALMSILQKPDIWLTHTNYLNDDEELIHGRHVATQALEEELQANKGKDRDTFVQSILDRIRNPKLEAVYVCCFCKLDDLLSQWRAYGANGTGVSIKFDVSRFKTITGPDSPIDGLLRLWEVFYKIDTQKQIVKGSIDFYFSHPKFSTALPEVRVEQAIFAIEFFLPTFKNANFHEEKEHRFIFSPKPTPTVVPRFRMSRGMLVPYYSLQDLKANANLVEPLPIEGVRVGPSPNKTLNAASIKLLLDQSGLSSISVEKSSTPYRG